MIFVQYMGTFLRKLYTKNEQKLSGRFWEINILNESWRRRRTTDDKQINIRKTQLSFGWRRKNQSLKLKHVYRGFP